MGAKVTAKALVAERRILGALRSRSHSRGVFAPGTQARRRKLRGRVLVLDAAKGGVATAWMLHEMKARGVMPAALVLNRANPIMVQGAALADFTMISGFDLDITKAIPNGAEVGLIPRRNDRLFACSDQDDHRQCHIPSIDRTSWGPRHLSHRARSKQAPIKVSRWSIPRAPSASRYRFAQDRISVCHRFRAGAVRRSERRRLHQRRGVERRDAGMQMGI